MSPRNDMMSLLHYKKNPLEEEIQQKIIAFLRAREWVVKETHGNMFQSGFPDLYCAHKRYGARWVEVKRPKGFKFTPAQLEFFPKLGGVGIGVWILQEATEDSYQLLFGPPNFAAVLLRTMV